MSYKFAELLCALENLNSKTINEINVACELISDASVAIYIDKSGLFRILNGALEPIGVIDLNAIFYNEAPDLSLALVEFAKIIQVFGATAAIGNYHIKFVLGTQSVIATALPSRKETDYKQAVNF